MKPTLEVKNLSLSYNLEENKPNEKRLWVFKDLSFQIEEGEFILLTGPSGCGKSSLINAINGVIPNLKDAYTEGYIYILGNEMANSSVRERTKIVGSVFQNPREQIIFDEVADEIVFPMENLGKMPQEMQTTLDELLSLTGLAKDAKTATLSGGEKQKLMTACTLGMGQKILILDEPLANMDARASAELLELLKKLSEEESYTVILVEHREEMILPYVDRIFSCVDSDAENVCMEIEIREDVEAYREELRTAVEEAAQKKALEAESVQMQSLKNTKGPVDREILFSVERLDYKIGGRCLFNDFSWEIRRGEEWVVLGDNGCGKTTLFRLLNDFIKPSAGKLSSLYSKKEKRKKLGYVLQNPDYQLFMPSVRSELYLSAKSPDFVEELIRLFKLEDMLDRHPLSLSEGQKRKLGFACIIANEPEVLFLDEPTVGLDTASVDQLLHALELLKARSKKPLTVVSISHDKRAIPHLGNQFLRLSK
ncbi:MAG: ABC transporter ATP-binding protein [Clostridiales bacterium]|nr:ABC transporter ATP-binding protein [Clostridiales bacterium]